MLPRTLYCALLDQKRAFTIVNDTAGGAFSEIVVSPQKDGTVRLTAGQCNERDAADQILGRINHMLFSHEFAGYEPDGPIFFDAGSGINMTIHPHLAPKIPIAVTIEIVGNRSQNFYNDTAYCAAIIDGSQSLYSVQETNPGVVDEIGQHSIYAMPRDVLAALADGEARLKGLNAEDLFIKRYGEQALDEVQQASRDAYAGYFKSILPDGMPKPYSLHEHHAVNAAYRESARKRGKPSR
jgi:hypothetical protein